MRDKDISENKRYWGRDYNKDTRKKTDDRINEWWRRRKQNRNYIRQQKIQVKDSCANECKQGY